VFDSRLRSSIAKSNIAHTWGKPLHREGVVASSLARIFTSAGNSWWLVAAFCAGSTHQLAGL
jgi:hypothetical protein